MKPEILAHASMLETCMPALEEAFTVHRTYAAEDAEALIAEVGPRIKAIATDGGKGVSKAVLDACPDVGMVASFGVGYDAIDIEQCRAKGVRVTNTPDVLNDAVAELALALMLGLCRKIPQTDVYVRDGSWAANGNYPLTAELTGRTVGILGLGRIGKEVALRCQAMRMRVVYHGRTEQPHLPYPYYTDLQAMARDVDWLVVVAPGTSETKGIVSRSVLEALGPEGCLVNVARGVLVDQAALTQLLTSGGLGGAALDVFETEPCAPEGLIGLDNVVLSPHQGSATHKTRWAMGDLVVRNLKAYFAGVPLISPVV